VNNFNNSLATLSQSQRKKAFQQFLSEANRLLLTVTIPAFLHLLNLPSRPCRHPDCRGRDLPTFLINPIQRLPRYGILFCRVLGTTGLLPSHSWFRYILLLQELQKLTPPKHKDYKNITRALADVKQMTEFINKYSPLCWPKELKLICS